MSAGLARMTIEEALQVADRFRERRAKGLPLHATPAEEAAETTERIAEEDSRLEKEVQREVRKRYIAFGCTVYNLSQARASKQTAGLGDLYVIHCSCRTAFWHETKTPRGEQSAAQRDFELWNREAGVIVVIGGVLAAEEQLIKIGAAYRINGSLEPKKD